jgi:predicted SAM-dependent methyltransferase
MPDGSVAEIYAGHMLEHLEREDARGFLRECHRVLVPGGRLGIVVPDTHQIMARYISGARAVVEWPEGTFRDLTDLDEIAAMFLYSTDQESRHQWSYDIRTLARLVSSCGFEVTGEIDRHNDPRLGTGRWYQCGVDAVKAG